MVRKRGKLQLTGFFILVFCGIFFFKIDDVKAKELFGKGGIAEEKAAIIEEKSSMIMLPMYELEFKLQEKEEKEILVEHVKVEKTDEAVKMPKTLKEVYQNLYLDSSFYENRQDMMLDIVEEDLGKIETGNDIDIMEDEVPQGRARFKGEEWAVVVDLDEEALPQMNFKTKRKAVIASTSGVELFLKPLLVILGILVFSLTAVERMLKRNMKRCLEH